MYKVKLSSNASDSKVSQIVNLIARDIEKGKFQKEEKLPSINQFSEENSVARDTIEKAYKQLRRQGYIASFPGRGYFVLDKKSKQIKVLLIFNKLSSFKKIIYETFLESLGVKAKVDLQIHNYDPKRLKSIIEESLGKYDYYVIMPHFFSGTKEKDYIDVIKMVPSHELVLLDKNLSQLTYPYRTVYQDFKEDIYQALQSLAFQLVKYKSITLVLPEDIHHPKEIAEGVKGFCDEQQLSFYIMGNVGKVPLHKYTVYIVTDDDNLARLLRNIREAKWTLGKDIGIISFNETVFKDLLNITVLSTDFEEMGRTAAKLVLGKRCEKYKNPFTVIQRSSL